MASDAQARSGARRSRRTASRVGAVAASFTLTLTVLASTVTAAPTLPAWVLLPLEASGMPAHMTGGTIVTTTAERADITISLADHAAQERAAEATLAAAADVSKARTESLASRAQRPEKAAPAVVMNESPVSTPGGDSPVLVPDAGEETLPEPEPTTEPAPAPEVTEEPAAEPVEEPTEPAEAAEPVEPEPVEEPVQEMPAESQPEPAPEESAEEPASPEEGSTPSPSPSTSPSPSPSPSTSPTPAPSPSPSATPSPTPSATPTPKPTPTPTPTPRPTPTPTPTPTPPAGDTGTARTTLFALLNVFRQANGLPPVAYNTHLQGVAQGWANHLADWEPASMGSAHNPRMTQQVGCRGYSTGTWGSCSELIVRNTGGASMNFNTLLTWLHTWWTQSDGHRPWMLSDTYTHVGYGFAWSDDRVPYAVTVIAQKH
ncbi:Uncharacterized conserved protein YkwD, contains CAP (CSP/antigen 5/PR1) domain [Georgenia satyanarayanai]|uniref:Uncharacterized conserved protein YkwD, contains CAP (CSP/antigen 5/PR1) domain n=1 Tax=Georgenia satyanarayanai TaxID=860221 RepID=A0A2Y9AAV4_9MICO|nr:CAP domain-containing protein [Georgenia satyanarayanai]PYG01168.1 uncharacterized protein YkwD [Georgenia satyanarayanai]SSA39407.1 Uncharacterized conserved protein YkwD, contains CAP (CSP/antigen 5/PR1) domain [Georgenia satyanarayanai]